jgi:Glyoxalase-like domain
MAHVFQVTFDAANPMAVAEFWAAALGYVVQPPPDGYDTWDEFADAMGIPEDEREKLAAVVDPDGKGPRVLFQKVPEGKTVKNRVHLDVNVTEHGLEPGARRDAINAEVERLVALGATKLAEFDDPTGMWTVLQDVEGNEFCVQ